MAEKAHITAVRMTRDAGRTEVDKDIGGSRNMGAASLWTACDLLVKPADASTTHHPLGTLHSGLPLFPGHMFIAPYWREGEVCMTVRQPQRQKIFMGKFTQLCDFFTRLRPVTLICSVAFL
jgi:hypothetical protein